ncbi:hypothetical protein Scep_008647 [Stephania cephalantha]|uniref:Tubby C-terminal domain-containing protein n=1 Tax=Stephania cephalantha TaxID=152367 RepID=A0AAP0PPS9_9MAGN
MAMSGFKKSTLARQSSYNSLYVNPLNEEANNLADDNLHLTPRNHATDDKENALENGLHQQSCSGKKESEKATPFRDRSNSFSAGDCKTPTPLGCKKRALRSPSLQLCMQLDEPNSTFGLKLWDSFEAGDSGKSNLWDHSDSEAAAPPSSWYTLPNRSLLCMPLPVDVGRCTCIIVKEPSLEGLDGGSLYSLFTNEGRGRQDRKLAVAHHRRQKGRSVFDIAKNAKGLSSGGSDESFLGTVTANFMGSKYHIWDQGTPIDSLMKQSKRLLAVVAFVPTVTTCTGSYRSLRAWIPKHHSMQLKSSAQFQHINGLPKDWEVKKDKTQQLFSRNPHYNRFLRSYELDFRERAKAELKIQRSTKNFQLTLEENGRQTILQLGKVGKSKYVMEYRYPLTGYQAFCICLASVDSKLCCTV